MLVSTFTLLSVSVTLYPFYGANLALTFYCLQLSYSLRSRIERVDKPDRRAIVSRIREGCSPLFIACKKGNVEIVEYLVSMCSANLEQRGLYEVQDDR